MTIIIDANTLESLEECLEWTLERLNRLGLSISPISEEELYSSILTFLQMIIVRVFNIESLKEKTEFSEDECNVISFALGQLCTEVEVDVDQSIPDIRDMFINFLKTKTTEQVAILLWAFIEGYYSF